MGFILPKDLIDSMHLNEGDEVFANTDDGGLRITPYDPEFELTMQAFERGRKKYKDALRQLAK